MTSPANVTLHCHAVKSTALPDVPLSQNPLIKLMIKFSSFFCFGKLLCILKFVLVFCIIPTSNVVFPFCLYVFRKKAQKLNFWLSLCSCEILPSNALTLLSQACLRVKSGSLPHLHSLLQIHANLQSSVI